MSEASDPEKNSGTKKNPLKRMGSPLLPWVLAVGIVFIILLVLAVAIHYRFEWLKEDRQKAAEQRSELKVNVAVWPVETSKLVDAVNLPGRVSAWESLVIQAQVSGRVMEILKDEGDEVKQGDVIARIDDRDYKAALEKAKAVLLLSRQSLERTRGLHKQGALPQAELDKALAESAQARASVETAKLSLERCAITAPFGGTINNRFISIGTLVNTGSQVVELLDKRRVKIDIGIPETDIAQVRDLDTAVVTVDSLSGKTFTGKKIFLAWQPLKQAQVYRLRLAVDNEEGLLRPGMFGEARIIREVVPEAIMIPLYAVVARGEETFCYIVEDDRAVRRDIVMGRTKGIFAEILSGIGPGDQLIVQGQRQVEPGGAVNIAKTLEQPVAARP